jgi:predicted nucleic acid-binding protein
MSFLLDTNVVSEWTKAQPNRGVLTWLADVDEDRTFLSVVTLAELRHGVERLPASKHRLRLDEWLRGALLMRFEARVLPVDAAVADEWGRIVSRCESRGKPISTMDAFVAATASVRALTLVTRNTKDFEFALKAVLNPWT